MSDRIARFFGLCPYYRPSWRVKWLHDNGFTVGEMAVIFGTSERRIRRKLWRAATEVI